MTTSDTKSQYPSAPQDQDATIALFRALSPHVNPYSKEDNEQYLRALHHETGGSDDGLALAIELLSKGDGYPDTDKLANKWKSYNGSTEAPVTLGAIRELVESYGFDWAEICSSAEPDFEPIESDAQPPDTPQAPENPLDRYPLNEKLHQLEKEVVEQIL